MIEQAKNKIYAFTKEDTQLAKGVGILLMCFHHLFFRADLFSDYGLSYFPFSKRTTLNLGLCGKICVGIFVLLSAYGMTVTIRKKADNGHMTPKDYHGFVLRRYYNLMAGWLFTFLSCEIFCLIMDGRPLHVYGDAAKSLAPGLESGLYFVINALGLQNLFDTPTLLSTWWYMSLAVIIVFIFPILFKGYKTFGGVIMMVMAIVLVRLDKMNQADFCYYLCTMVVGIILADHDAFARLKAWNPIKKTGPVLNKILKLLVAALGLFFCYKCRSHLGGYYASEINHTLLAILVIYFSYELFSDIPGVKQVLMFFGKHSFKMYLVQGFIYKIYFKDWLYSFHYSLLIWLILVAICLAVAVALDLLERVLGYKKLVGYIRGKLFPA